MGKFILSEITKKIEDKTLAMKTAVKFQMAGGISLVMDQLFGFYHLGLNGYVKGKPSIKDKWLIKNVVIPAIDKKYNQKSIDKLKIIVEKKQPSTEDIKFIKDEVIPYFNTNCKRLTGKELEMIGFPTNENFEVFKSKIDKEVKKGKKIDASLTKNVLEEIKGVKKVR